MKFYAVKQRFIESVWRFDNSKSETILRGINYDRYPTHCSFSFHAHVIPINNKNVTDRKNCAKLATILSNYTSSTNTDVQNSEKWKLEMEFDLSTAYATGASFQGHVKLKNSFAGGYLEAIRHLSKNEATIQIDYMILSRQNYAGAKKVALPPQCELMSSELPISNGNLPCCEEDLEMVFPGGLIPQNFNPDLLNGLLTITVTIPDSVLEANSNLQTVENISCPTKLSPQERILQTKILSDVTIVTDSGACVMAHKVFLANQSPVFHTMFNIDMTEKKESRVEMPEISEENVHAFLRYVYYEDMSVIKGNMEHILELYSAAHKYQVASLEKLLRNTIIEKPTCWFDLDGTLKIFVLTQSAQPVDHDLQEKCIQVLKVLMKNFSDGQIQQHLLVDYPTAALELCKIILADEPET